MAGRMVICQSILATNNLRIDVSTLQTGIYFLEMQEGEMRFYGKLVVEK
jgi:hypothetical protein